MKPISTTWEAGRDVWGRRVMLTCENANGKQSWTIHAVALDQRDEDSRIFGLSDETILAMAEAVRGRGGK